MRVRKQLQTAKKYSRKSRQSDSLNKSQPSLALVGFGEGGAGVEASDDDE